MLIPAPSILDLYGHYCIYVEYKKSGPDDYYEFCHHEENELKTGGNCCKDLCPLTKKEN